MLTRMDADAALRSHMIRRTVAGVRELLEQKHLYQAVTVEYQDETIASLAGQAPHEVQAVTKFDAMLLKGAPWDVAPMGPGMSGNNLIIDNGPLRREIPRLQVTAPDVKLYCANNSCRRLEPFNPLSCIELWRGASVRPARQMFALQYVCRSCKGTPEVFLVRRLGDKLTLVGRSPIEHVAVPAVLPQPLHRFYSGAIVAHQSGHTLSGNFMFRVLIEQWVRMFPPAASLPKADQAIDWYVAALPVDFRTRFPTLRDTYSSLSGDIHAATGSPAVFDDAAAKIEKHFRAWELFELDPATFGAAPSAEAGGSAQTTGD